MTQTYGQNLFSGLPAELPQELTDVLLAAPGLRVERIVSRGQASPPGFWYDQPEHEWVLLLQGAARLRIVNADGAERDQELQPGDYLHIPAHQRHRVEWTHPTDNTIWLAVFFSCPLQ
ncbi:Cupin domain protein [Anatilimnocola aggregata]|uniref:Cupin domain protein n=1 Tax=Anatilimnocola aggregata TaxID=2528021 RepID=A0A517Y7W9_9BACT|nr:cupin domain-containing protein [Anatilimnocola aggregata]QDU26337.1 Cupin domain protein [Anatilimnocola aggregata]